MTSTSERNVSIHTVLVILQGALITQETPIVSVYILVILQGAQETLIVSVYILVKVQGASIAQATPIEQNCIDSH